MSKIKGTFKNIWNDESAQGATEYILLLVVVVGLAMVFKDKIRTAFTGKLEEVGGNIDSFKVD